MHHSHTWNSYVQYCEWMQPTGLKSLLVTRYLAVFWVRWLTSLPPHTIYSYQIHQSQHKMQQNKCWSAEDLTGLTVSGEFLCIAWQMRWSVRALNCSRESFFPSCLVDNCSVCVLMIAEAIQNDPQLNFKLYWPIRGDYFRCELLGPQKWLLLKCDALTKMSFVCAPGSVVTCHSQHTHSNTFTVNKGVMGWYEKICYLCIPTSLMP